MGKRIKKSLITMGILLMSFFVWGCSIKSKIANEEKCFKDFVKFEKDLLPVLETFNFENGHEKDYIKIDKRQTNGDKKKDTVYCTIKGDNEYATHKYECVLYYNYYDEGDWILDNVEIVKDKVKMKKVIEEKELFDIVNDILSQSDIQASNYGKIMEESTPQVDYSQYVTFHTEKKNTAFGYSAEGVVDIQLSYNATIGQWITNDYTIECDEQEMIGFTDCAWQKVKGSNRFMSPTYLKFVGNEDNDDYDIYASKIDSQYNETGEEQQVAFLIDLDVLNNTAGYYWARDTVDMVTFLWDEEKICITNDSGKIDYYERVETPETGSVR